MNSRPFNIITQGLAPEVVPSFFAEDLHPASFEDIHEYPVATATHKAVEVYERLVVRFTSNSSVLFFSKRLFFLLFSVRTPRMVQIS